MSYPGSVPLSRRRAVVRGASVALAAAGTTAVSSRASAAPSGGSNGSFPLGPFHKSPRNPIMRPNPAHEWESAYLYNPSAVVVGDRVALLYRAQNAAKTSSIGLAFSTDGINFQRLSRPVLAPTEPWETPGGCEDPRVVHIRGTYYMTYTAYDGERALLCLATSSDLVHWTKHPPLFPNLPDPGHGPKPWNKSGAIVPVALHGWYWMYFGESNIFWARSRDLLHWETPGDKDPVARPVFPWEKSLIEPGPAPMPTDDGHLLLVYNGQSDGSGGHRKGQYSGGQMLIDPRDPTTALARLERPFIFPTDEDEQHGQVNHVVFSEGLVRFHDRWFLYYGMADSVLGVATTTPTALR